MRNKSVHATALVLVILTVIFSLSPATSSLMNDVIIRSTGQMATVGYARSGSARDIQAAVDGVAGHGDMGNVYIPEGTFNFVDVGESWTGARVTIPAGINLFGAPTERDANGLVIEWKTVLVMPSEVAGSESVGIPIWFRFVGSSDPTKPSRFSDIQLSGYRTIDPASTSMHVGVQMGGGNEGGVINFRVDHCYFLNTAGGGVHACGSELQNGPDTISGVVDHCKFVNTAGTPNPYETRTVDYGVHASRGGGWATDYLPWEDDITKILGKYTDYTVFVEDCYFEKWRHCVVSRSGAHVVLRHSTIRYDFGYGSVDIHGDSPGRALEVYNCILSDVISPPSQDDILWQRAGGGAIFNNTVTDYRVFVYLTRENPASKYWPHDVWVWNNSLPAGLSPVTTDGGPAENVDYFLYPMPNYQPYPYPHPLTLGM